MTSSEQLKTTDTRFKGLKNIEHYFENGLYKYTFGASSNYNEIRRLRKEIAPKFQDAFIIAFRNGEKTNINEAIKEFLKRRNR